MKIVTLRPRIPWVWVPVICLPWVAGGYVEFCSGAPLTFTLRKFVDDPVVISLLSSINVAFNFLVGAVACYMSDRIWTRHGRRRPFLVLGWLGVAVSLWLIPVVGSLGALIVVVLVYQFFQDIASPVEPLYNEVIPQSQRGRASIVRLTLVKASGILCSAVLIAQYDSRYRIAAFGKTVRFGGDHVIFALGSLFLLVVVAVMFFFVRESEPLHRPRIERFKVGQFVKTMFGDRQSWMVYALWMAPALIGAGMGALMPLFQTEQLGLTKKDLGFMGAVWLPFDLLLFTPLSGYLVDRVNRLRLMQLGILIPALVSLAFFVYVRWVAHFVVTVWTVLSFGLAGGFFSAWMYTVWGPVLYDYIPANRMGTVSAGLCIVGGVSRFVLMNLGGLWVKAFTSVFGPVGRPDARPPRYDYSCGYILNFLLALVALGLLLVFERAVKQGRVIPYGRLELKEEEQREKPAAAQEAET